jgi:hypothetical protein
MGELKLNKNKENQGELYISPAIRDPYTSQGLTHHTNFQPIQYRATVTLIYR